MWIFYYFQLNNPTNKYIINGIINTINWYLIDKNYYIDLLRLWLILLIYVCDNLDW